MVSSAAASVKQYLDELPPERRAVVARVRAAMRKAMPKGYEEAMNWGAICYQIPLERYPDTYNGQPLAFVGIAAQKNNYGLYLMGLYGDAGREATLKAAFDAIGRKPDMGKACVRFRKLEDVPLEAIAKWVSTVSVEDYLAWYEKAHPPKARRR